MFAAVGIEVKPKDIDTRPKDLDLEGTQGEACMREDTDHEGAEGQGQRH